MEESDDEDFATLAVGAIPTTIHLKDESQWTDIVWVKIQKKTKKNRSNSAVRFFSRRFFSFKCKQFGK